MSEAYVGIDYGRGQTNIDLATGIRFGVIPQNDVHPDALDDIMTQGVDVAFKESKESCIKALKDGIQAWYDEVYPVEEDAHEGTLREILKLRLIKVLSDHTMSYTAQRIAEEITEGWNKGDDEESAAGPVEGAIDNHYGDGYQSDNGLGDYLYEKDGYKITGDSQGDLWVFRSKFYTYAQFCSPCAPGAGYLRNNMDPESGAPKVYCLGFDWFDQNAPYRIWRVEDDVEIVLKEVKVECPNCKGTGRDTVSRMVLVRQTHRDNLIAEIQAGTIQVQDFQFNPDGESTFKCWRCGGAGHTIEKQEVEKYGYLKTQSQ